MRESIESWKALILCVEMFCLGGSIFADRKSAARNVLWMVMMLSAMALIVCA